MKYVTLKQLTDFGACDDQGGLFKRTFPKGRAAVTVKNAERYASVFDFQWAALNLLSRSARAKYRRVTTAALAEYCRVWAAGDRATAAARAEYDRATTAAWIEYDRVCAVTFARLYGSSGDCL